MRKLSVCLNWLVLCGGALLLVAACGGGGGGGYGSSGGSANSTRISNYLATQTPGDVWSWTISMTDGSGTFSATNETAHYAYSGTATALSNGFLNLAVTYTTDPGVASLPAYAYAMEVPGTAIIVKPVGPDSKVIVGVAQGTCPTAVATYNWVTIPWDTWTSATDTAYGVSSSAIAGSTFDFSHNKYLLGGATAPSSPSTSAGFTCANGKFTNATEPTIIGITPSGVFVGDAGPGAGGFVGVQAPASDVDLMDLALAGREFRGVLFKNNTTGQDTQPVWARPNGSGGLTGGGYIDFEANSEDMANQAALVFSSQPNPGIVSGTLTDPAAHTFTMMINKIGGKYMIFGISTNESAAQPYNFLAMEK